MDTIKNKIYLPVDGGPISNDRPPRPPPLPPLPPPRPPRPLPPPRPLKDIADYVVCVVYFTRTTNRSINEKCPQCQITGQIHITNYPFALLTS